MLTNNLIVFWLSAFSLMTLCWSLSNDTQLQCISTYQQLKASLRSNRTDNVNRMLDAFYPPNKAPSHIVFVRYCVQDSSLLQELQEQESLDQEDIIMTGADDRSQCNNMTGVQHEFQWLTNTIPLLIDSDVFQAITFNLADLVQENVTLILDPFCEDIDDLPLLSTLTVWLKSYAQGDEDIIKSYSIQLSDEEDGDGGYLGIFEVNGTELIFYESRLVVNGMKFVVGLWLGTTSITFALILHIGRVSFKTASGLNKVLWELTNITDKIIGLPQKLVGFMRIGGAINENKNAENETQQNTSGQQRDTENEDKTKEVPKAIEDDQQWRDVEKGDIEKDTLLSKHRYSTQADVKNDVEIDNGLGFSTTSDIKGEDMATHDESDVEMGTMFNGHRYSTQADDKKTSNMLKRHSSASASNMTTEMTITFNDDDELPAFSDIQTLYESKSSGKEDKIDHEADSCVMQNAHMQMNDDDLPNTEEIGTIGKIGSINETDLTDVESHVIQNGNVFFDIQDPNADKTRPMEENSTGKQESFFNEATDTIKSTTKFFSKTDSAARRESAVLRNDLKLKHSFNHFTKSIQKLSTISALLVAAFLTYDVYIYARDARRLSYDWLILFPFPFWFIVVVLINFFTFLITESILFCMNKEDRSHSKRTILYLIMRDFYVSMSTTTLPLFAFFHLFWFALALTAFSTRLLSSFTFYLPLAIFGLWLLSVVAGLLNQWKKLLFMTTFKYTRETRAKAYCRFLGLFLHPLLPVLFLPFWILFLATLYFFSDFLLAVVNLEEQSILIVLGAIVLITITTRKIAKNCLPNLEYDDDE